jgi:nucleotide-binding universal stress UspA family protein
MRILLPVDGAFDAKLIIDFVCNYRWLRGTEFKLLHVVGSSHNEDEVIEQVEKAEGMLDEIAQRITRYLADANVEQEVVTGMPVYEILQKARGWQANMIVMGYRAGISLNQHLAGSVSRGVTLQAPCSVVVIRPPAVQHAPGAHHCGTIENEFLLEA